MKTFIITEKDIERLQEIYSNDGDSWWHNSRMDEWVETLNELPTPKKQVFDEGKTEFAKFIEEDNFIKPQQPYYVREGKVFDYGDLRQLFLESKKSAEKE